VVKYINMTRIAIGILMSVLCAPLPGQWIKQPTQGIPRTPEGKANLTAPAPRTSDGKPDLSGMWQLSLGAGFVANLATELKPEEVRPWAAAIYKERSENLGKDDPWTVQCQPLGTRHITNGGAAKIIQTPGLIAILYEDLAYRQIHMDGRALPKDPNPTFMGYSVGRWDGDTLVVDSIGFKDTTWLDMGGHPHTEDLHVTERFHRRDFGHMDFEVTFEDPKAYARPWTVKNSINLVADTELLEFVCAENERDRAHLVGRTAEEKEVKVAPEILKQYVGTYEVTAASGSAAVVQRFTVTLDGAQLLLEIAGRGKAPMYPLSQTTFSPRYLGTYEFVKDSQGVVTHLIAYSTEGDLKAVRRR
jgi:hypothetical protein